MYWTAWKSLILLFTSPHKQVLQAGRSSLNSVIGSTEFNGSWTGTSNEPTFIFEFIGSSLKFHWTYIGFNELPTNFQYLKFEINDFNCNLMNSVEPISGSLEVKRKSSEFNKLENENSLNSGVCWISHEPNIGSTEPNAVQQTSNGVQQRGSTEFIKFKVKVLI